MGINFSSGSRRCLNFRITPFTCPEAFHFHFTVYSFYLWEIRGGKYQSLKNFFHTVSLFQLYLADQVCTWLVAVWRLSKFLPLYCHHIKSEENQTPKGKLRQKEMPCISLRPLLSPPMTSFPVAAERYFCGFCGSL